MGRGVRLALAALSLAALACNTLYRLATIPDPEGLATDAVGLPASATPRPTRTPAAETALPAGTPRPTLPADFNDLLQFEAGLLPGFAGDLNRLPEATRYTLDLLVTFHPDGTAAIEGRQRVRYTNRQAFALEAIYLMLWPNHDDQYFSRLTLGPVTVDGALIEPQLSNGDLAARLPLGQPLAPRASLELSTEFSVEAYPGIDASGAARFGLTNGVLLAPTFYPLIPRIVDGEWQIDPAPPGGDTTNSDSAFYLWRVTAPDEMAIVGTGTVVDDRRSGGRQTQTLAAGPMRDLALVVGPLELSQRQVGGVMINAYLLAEHADLADEMLDYTEGQLRVLQDQIGPYPFAELDVVDAPGAFGGIEYPGVIFIGVVGPDEFFEIATVHEVGHQWFYSLVGNDQLLEPWLDEGFATYSEVLYFESTRGAQAGQAFLESLRGLWQIADDQTWPIGWPVGRYPTPDDYYAIVYGKGAFFLAALRTEVGDQVFFEILRDYFAAYRYEFATTADFHLTAEAACACDLDDLFDRWVYAGGSVEP